MYIHPTHMYYTYIHMAWLSCICIRICMYDMTCMFPWLICTYDSCAYAILPLMCMRDSFVCDIIKWHDSFVNVTWLICICDINKWHDSFVHVTWLICTCDVTHLYMWQDSFVYVTSSSGMTHLDMWHDWFLHVTGLICICNTTPCTHTDESCHPYEWVILYLWHDSSLFANTSVFVTWLICICDMQKQMSHVTQMNESFCTYKCVHWCVSFVNVTSPTLQHTATHCNTLQHTAIRCHTLQHTATQFVYVTSPTQRPTREPTHTRKTNTTCTRNTIYTDTTHVAVICSFSNETNCRHIGTIPCVICTLFYSKFRIHE